MNKLICWLKEIWRSIPQLINGNYPISGHLFVDKEYHTGCNVTISECEECGKIDISWSGGKEVDSIDEFTGEHLFDVLSEDAKNGVIHTYENRDEFDLV